MEIDDLQRVQAILSGLRTDPQVQKVALALRRAKLSSKGLRTGKRGRPSKNGVRPPEYLFRRAVALSAYEVARSSGEKYEVALQIAVHAVQEMFPDTPMSTTEMKRFLSEVRSPSSDNTLFFDKTGDGGPHAGLQVWAIRMAPMPDYPRHNARKPEPPRIRTPLADAVFNKK